MNAPPHLSGNYLKLLVAHNLHSRPTMLTLLLSRHPSPGIALVRSVLLSLLGMGVVFASLRLATWQASVVPALAVTGFLLAVMLLSMIPRWRARWAASQQLPAE